MKVEGLLGGQCPPGEGKRQTFGHNGKRDECNTHSKIVQEFNWGGGKKDILTEIRKSGGNIVFLGMLSLFDERSFGCNRKSMAMNK